MKTIGLLGGMTWESTMTYYQVINTYISKAAGGMHSAHCVLYSVDFQGIFDTFAGEDWAAAERILTDAGRKLKSIGADVLVLATNTMHIVAPQVQAAVGLPLLHIAQVTADRLKADGVTQVGLLGTTFTMEKAFYKDVLLQNGITPIIPEADARQDIFRIINEELAFGTFTAESRGKFCAEIERFRALGAGGVILGCTEIGLLIQQQHSVLPVYDTALIHAEEAAKYALREG